MVLRDKLPLSQREFVSAIANQPGTTPGGEVDNHVMRQREHLVNDTSEIVLGLGHTQPAPPIVTLTHFDLSQCSLHRIKVAPEH